MKSRWSRYISDALTKRPHCCSVSLLYSANQQIGQEMPAYIGTFRQKGHGLGTIVGGLFRRILPFLGQADLSIWSSIGGELTSGKNFKETIKARFSKGIKYFASSVVNPPGSGVRRAWTRRPARCPRQKKEEHAFMSKLVCLQISDKV